MCLAVPMEIVELQPDKKAIARQGSTNVEIDVSLLDDPHPGDYVIIHAGFAIETLDIEEADARIEWMGKSIRSCLIRENLHFSVICVPLHGQPAAPIPVSTNRFSG